MDRKSLAVWLTARQILYHEALFVLVRQTARKKVICKLMQRKTDLGLEASSEQVMLHYSSSPLFGLFQVLLFVDEPKLHVSRLHRVFRNLCYHVPTRAWLVRSLLSILQRTQELQQAERVSYWLKLGSFTHFSLFSNARKRSSQQNGWVTDLSLARLLTSL